MLHFKAISIGHQKTLFRVPELELKRGYFYALIGRNGIGKTTFFNTILGHLKTLSGHVVLDGKNCLELSQLERAKLVAFVPSKFEGVHHLTGEAYVALGRAPYTNFLGKLNPKDWQVVHEIFTSLAIQHLAQQDTLQMSDGERQILSIAKALVQDVPVILLDEPTAFLDYPNRIKILSLLQKLAHEKNLCIIQSSHDLDLCVQTVDAFLLFQEGSLILETNSPDLSKEKLLQLAFNLSSSDLDSITRQR